MLEWISIRIMACMSLPSRGAWIEICALLSIFFQCLAVAPLAGSVDRNNEGNAPLLIAPRSLPSRGAWIEIQYFFPMPGLLLMSLPSRGAWIEIYLASLYLFTQLVAPLAGSVDRNAFNGLHTLYNGQSLPSRGAWIEIPAFL